MSVATHDREYSLDIYTVNKIVYVPIIWCQKLSTLCHPCFIYPSTCSSTYTPFYYPFTVITFICIKRHKFYQFNFDRLICPCSPHPYRDIELFYLPSSSLVAFPVSSLRFFLYVTGCNILPYPLTPWGWQSLPRGASVADGNVGGHLRYLPDLSTIPCTSKYSWRLWEKRPEASGVPNRFGRWVIVGCDWW